MDALYLGAIYELFCQRESTMAVQVVNGTVTTDERGHGRTFRHDESRDLGVFRDGIFDCEEFNLHGYGPSQNVTMGSPALRI